MGGEMARVARKAGEGVDRVGKILYIAGYGRSGSTLLSIMLGNHPGIVDVGEVAFLAGEWVDTRRTCACGQPYRSCPFWKDLPPGLLEPEQAALLRRVERARSLPRLLSNRISPEQGRAYRAVVSELCDYVLRRSSASILVDASKSARNATGRFLALARVAGQDVYVLHLVRNGLAVVESRAVTGSNLALQGIEHKTRFPALQATLGWVSTNLLVLLLARFVPTERYLRLRYEDLVAEPATTLRRIAGFAGFDPAPLLRRLEQGEGFRVGHEVGGNRLRHSGVVHLHRELPQAGARLNRAQRLLFTLLGGWLNRLFGY
ncbi:MAG: sulfotransferase [Caldilineae bacterium]|nr:MAG: sulfotransferase [Caldilineae bacterium]